MVFLIVALKKSTRFQSKATPSKANPSNSSIKREAQVIIFLLLVIFVLCNLPMLMTLNLNKVYKHTDRSNLVAGTKFYFPGMEFIIFPMSSNQLPDLSRSASQVPYLEVQLGEARVPT
ncbi:hypothetical protein RRG08_021570 [Elysia crispata]|uniref:Uncharacterized protein n=1 Tax=Elysia crispata TaxID=231223 RepID=A0AAE0XDM9_9GAST|nr:hypothetical protein RRG08_021570 [Elysia crispata]